MNVLVWNGVTLEAKSELKEVLFSLIDTPQGKIYFEKMQAN
jgi:hypothetical protein